MLNGIHHISLKARGEAQFRQVLDFYRDVLGCPLVRAWGQGDGQGAMLDLGNTLLEVTANGPAELGKGLFGHIAFATDDVDGMAERLRAAGRDVFLPPTDKNLGGSYPIRIAFCTGPAGEELEFFQELGPKEKK